MSSVIPDPAVTDWIPLWNGGGAPPATQPSVRVYRSTVLSFANSAWTTIPFDTVKYDRGPSAHWSAANPTRLTCQVAGTYVVSGQIYFTTSNVGIYRVGTILLNGSTLTESGQTSPIGSAPVRAQPTTVIYMNVGDYVELAGYQDTGGALNSFTSGTQYVLEFEMAMVGGMQGPQGIPGTQASYGVTLPASPSDGQEAILVDSVTNPSYQWRFRYNAGSSSAYKWEFIGGTPKRVRTDAGSAALAAGGWTAELPAFLVPRAGDYLAAARAMFINSGGAVLLGIGIFAPGLMNNSTTHAYASTYQGLETSDNECPGMASGGQIAIGYYAGTAGQTFQSRQITVTPVRVS